MAGNFFEEKNLMDTRDLLLSGVWLSFKLRVPGGDSWFGISEPNLSPPITIETSLHKRCATSARLARKNSLRMGGFPESMNYSAIPVQNDFLFNQPHIHLLEFSHDPTGHSPCVS